MSDGTIYQPGLNGMSLETMPFVWGDTALANASGTSAMATGSDNAASAKKSMDTPPETTPKMNVVQAFFDAIDTAIYGNIPPFSSVKSRPGVADQKKQTQEQTQRVIWSVILVVVGLMLLSRGFGMIGEEGESVVVNLSNPSKFPGIGHAIQGMKGKGK